MPAAPARTPLAASRGIRDRRGQRFAGGRAVRVFARPTVTGFTYPDSATGTLILGGQVPVEIGGLAVTTPRHDNTLPVNRGMRDRKTMYRWVPRQAVVAPTVPVFVDTASGALIFGGTRTDARTGTDTSTGTLILGGQVPVEIGGLTVVTPRHDRFLPLSRKIRDRTAMHRYVRANSFAPAPLFVDAQTGALVFGGTRTDARTGTDTRTGTLILGGQVPVEVSGLHITPVPHGRQMPILRGVRDRSAMRRYTRPSVIVGPALFSDVRSGTLIWGGSSSETYTPPTVPGAAVQWTTIGTFIRVS